MPSVWLLALLTLGCCAGISAAEIAAQPPILMPCDIGGTAKFRMPVSSTGHTPIVHNGSDVVVVLDKSLVKAVPPYTERIENQRIDNGFLTFALKNVSKDDEGTYQGYNGAEKGGAIPNSSQSLICIALERTHVTASQPPTQGGTTTLTCVSTFSAKLPEDWDQTLSYIWFKDGDRLPQQKKREARLEPLTPDMQGNYTCCPSVDGRRCVALEEEKEAFSLTLADPNPGHGLAIGLPVAVVVLVALGATAWCYSKKRRGKKPDEDIEMENHRDPMLERT